jgi:hypothetical protein
MQWERLADRLPTVSAMWLTVAATAGHRTTTTQVLVVLVAVAALVRTALERMVVAAQVEAAQRPALLGAVQIMAMRGTMGLKQGRLVMASLAEMAAPIQAAVLAA